MLSLSITTVNQPQTISRVSGSDLDQFAFIPIMTFEDAINLAANKK